MTVLSKIPFLPQKFNTIGPSSQIKQPQEFPFDQIKNKKPKELVWWSIFRTLNLLLYKVSSTFFGSVHMKFWSGFILLCSSVFCNQSSKINWAARKRWPGLAWILLRRKINLKNGSSVDCSSSRQSASSFSQVYRSKGRVTCTVFDQLGCIYDQSRRIVLLTTSPYGKGWGGPYIKHIKSNFIFFFL